jgi:hypothetical protein
MARAFLGIFLVTSFLSLVVAQEARPQNPFSGARPAPAPAPPAGPGLMKIRVEEGNITAQIVSMPLPNVLDELAARTGIVFELPSYLSTPVTVTFYKVSLREAVERLADTNNSIFYYATDAAGSSRISFVRIFARAPNKPPQQVSLRYLGSGTVTKTGDDSLDTPEQAMKVLAESDNIDVRQKAIDVLAKGKGDAAIEAITNALGDAAPEVRAAAIEALAGNGIRTALPQILLALKDGHPGVRQSAVIAVALLGDNDNVRQLQPLTRDKDASVAAAAEMAVRKLGSRRP